VDALPLVGALWLGVLTSISPCPLASNVAAIAFVARDLTKPRRVLLSGLLYTLGRTVAYVALAALLVFGLLSIPAVSNFLQKHLNQVLGPILIVAGVLLLDLLSVSLPSSGWSGQAVQGQVEHWGLAAAGLLGFLFALAFCPVSAALFFGSLIPLSLKHTPHLLYPVLYGIGTAVPVLVIAVALSTGASAVGKWLQQLGRVEAVARAATGILFVGVGLYYVLAHTLEVL
jgi:cytochrome c biogenesis protein CcdA